MNIKKYKVAIIALIVVVVILVVVILIFAFKNDDKKVIIESSYINYAWGFVYKGEVICNDGTMYTFDLSKINFNKLKNLTAKGYSKLILKNSKLKSKTVPSSDLEKIKEYSAEIKEKYEENISGADQGQISVKTYNYFSGKMITLNAKGDQDIINKSDNTDNLLEIVNKYISSNK